MQPPRSIGPYEVIRLLGRGGMGAVYEARHPALPRSVAVKVLPPGADAEALARFGREAQLLARIRHPNVVAVHGVGGSPLGPWLACDLVPGEGLDARIARGGLPWREVVRIGRALCGALGALHAVGLVHRDLKPANVIVRPDGEPVLLDFGLAREVDGGSLTRSGALVGTPAYMPPEQIDSSRVDARADVYALAATLFALLAGRAPFEAPTAPAVLMRVMSTPPAWDAVPPDVPASLVDALRAAMAKAPAERTPTAAALEVALARALEEPAPRGRSRAGLAVGLAVIAAALALGAALAATRREPEVPVGPGGAPATTARPVAPIARVAPVASTDVLERLQQRLPPPGLERIALWRDGRAALGAAGGPARAAALELRLAPLQRVPLAVHAMERRDGASWVTPLDDRRVLVASSADGSTRLLDLETDAGVGSLPILVPAPRTRGGLSGRAIGPPGLGRRDGGFVVATVLHPVGFGVRPDQEGDLVKVTRLDAGGAPVDSRAAVVGRPAVRATATALSADGRWLACGAAAAEVTLADLEQLFAPGTPGPIGTFVCPRAARERPVNALAFSPDGAWVVVAGQVAGNQSGESGYVTMHRTADLEREPLVTAIPSPVFCVLFHPGKRYVALGGMGFLFLLDLHERLARQATDLEQRTYGAESLIAFDLAGETLWTASNRTRLVPWRWPREGVPEPGQARARAGPLAVGVRVMADGALVLVSTKDPATVEVWAGELP